MEVGTKLLVALVGGLLGVTFALLVSVFAASEYRYRTKEGGTTSYVKLVSGILSAVTSLIAGGYFAYLMASRQQDAVGLIQAIRSLVGPFIVVFLAGLLVVSIVAFLVFYSKVSPPKGGRWYDLK